ncbi:carbon-phosphorus lyase complex subunit PhnI [Shigella sonnei]|nr:carbon-phosphorus lyase complex subunit PhnI [Shigella sonnei]
MYVAVKGGEKAIDAAHALQESRRRGDTDLPELSVAQIEQQLNLAVDRVMTEGGIADRELAALALKQASGDNVEAIFLLRAYRTTLAKLAVSEPLDTTGMRLERRISAVYKDIPGGQLLGPTYDYTHRLLDFTLLANGEAPTLTTADSEQQPSPHVFSLLARQGLVFGMSERKAMAMALVDRALQAPEYGEHATGPAQDEEFVLAHADNVEAAGFVSHLKLPHYVDFQAELELLKRLQQEKNHG